jgi:hypothetical protein
MKYLIIILLLASCTPQKRLARLVKKNPELIRVDTVTVTDTFTIITPRTQIDTFYSIKQLIDTVRLEKENLRILTYLKNDTIYLDAECDTLVVEKIRTVKVPTKTIEVKDESFWQSRWFKFLFIVIFVALLIRYLLSKQ